jgi:hypothetical protein
MMSVPVVVQIIGAPIACKDGIKDSWREVADWTAGQLLAHFGESLQVKYYDLFDENCPSIPEDTQLPLVLVNGEVFSSGGKISVPAIRQHVETLGIGR